jgi:DNA polymerase-3 subunit gamma/tau
MKLAHLGNVLVEIRSQESGNGNQEIGVRNQESGGTESRPATPATAVTTTISVMPSAPAMGKLKTTINLSATPVTLPQNQATTPVANDIERPQIVQNKSFTVAELTKTWHDFRIDREHSGGTMTEQVVLNREIRLNGTTIAIALDNQFQETVLNDLKPVLLGFLRQRLQNSQIVIEANVVMTEQKVSFYNPQAKFSAMAEKNPALLNLQQMLGLEVDF